MRRPVVDLTDDEARAALPLKWGTTPRGVLPAWVAEMDFALDPVVEAAVLEAVRRGVTGYPPERDPVLGAAYSGFAARHYGWSVDPDWVVPTVDVTAGMRIALDVLSEPGPVVVPLPAYPPQLALPAMCGRERIDLVLDPDDRSAGIDLDRLDAAFARGARTLILTQPHNPCGRVLGRAELGAIRDVVVRHGARVISDEIHAPLTRRGSPHTPYLALEGTADHAVAVVAASKAFNTAGLRCAQLVVPDADARARIDAEPLARNDSWSPLGVAAAVAAYEQGDPWLASLGERLAENDALLAALLAKHLPQTRMRPMEATYLAWLDLRAYGHDDPAAAAAHLVRISPGHDFSPGLVGHARLNIATSPERLTAIIERLARALR